MRRRPTSPRIDAIPSLLDQKLPAEIGSEAGFVRWFEPWQERVMVAV